VKRDKQKMQRERRRENEPQQRTSRNFKPWCMSRRSRSFFHEHRFRNSRDRQPTVGTHVPGEGEKTENPGNSRR